MNNVIVFILGMFVGGIVAVASMCLLIASDREEEWEGDKS